MAVDVRHQQAAGFDEAATESERLFTLYSGRIHSYCLYMLRDRGEAEDAVQTTFLLAHRALGRGTVPEFEYAWLHSIAKNACRMQRRTAARRGQAVGGVDLDAIPGRDADPDEQELAHGIGDALASLPERQRRALVMREWQGLSSEEVAAQMGMSAPATYALLTRARHSLARAMSVTTGRPALGLDLGTLLLKLRAMLAGGAAKAAATTAVVAGVAVAGIAVERAAADRSAPSPARLEAPSNAVVQPARASSQTLSRPRASVRRVAPTRQGRGEPGRGAASHPRLPEVPTTTLQPVSPEATSAASSTPAEERPTGLPVPVPAELVPVETLVDDLKDVEIPPLPVDLPVDVDGTLGGAVPDPPVDPELVPPLPDPGLPPLP